MCGSSSMIMRLWLDFPMEGGLLLSPSNQERFSLGLGLPNTRLCIWIGNDIQVAKEEYSLLFVIPVLTEDLV